MGRSAGQIAMAKRITGSIDTRPLAVPQRENSVMSAVTGNLRLLCAPAGSCGQILVDPRIELDVLLVEEGFRALQLLVISTQWRAAVTADVTRRVQSRLSVAPALLQRQSHQCLDPGHEHPPLTQRVFVIERHFARRGGGTGDWLGNAHDNDPSLFACKSALVGLRDSLDCKDTHSAP